MKWVSRDIFFSPESRQEPIKSRRKALFTCVVYTKHIYLDSPSQHIFGTYLEEEPDKQCGRFLTRHSRGCPTRWMYSRRWSSRSPGTTLHPAAPAGHYSPPGTGCSWGTGHQASPACGKWRPRHEYPSRHHILCPKLRCTRSPLGLPMRRCLGPAAPWHLQERTPTLRKPPETPPSARYNPTRQIDDNRSSEIQSINRCQSKRLVNWCRLASANRWPIGNHTKTFFNRIDCHRLSISMKLVGKPITNRSYITRLVIDFQYQSINWYRSLSISPFHSQEWSISNLPCSLSRNITSHNMENLVFHSLLRWKMIILSILTTSLKHFSLKRLGECIYWTWEWKG